jgi:hypothetical protein
MIKITTNEPPKNQNCFIGRKQKIENNTVQSEKHHNKFRIIPGMEYCDVIRKHKKKLLEFES